MANKLAYSDRDSHRDKIEAIPAGVLSVMVYAERWHLRTLELQKQLTAARAADNEEDVSILTGRLEFAEKKLHAELAEVGVRAMEWVDTLIERAGVTIEDAVEISRAGEL